MTPNQTLEHVLRWSCGKCANLQGQGGQRRCVADYGKCRSGKPSTAIPPLFKRRVK